MPMSLDPPTWVRTWRSEAPECWVLWGGQSCLHSSSVLQKDLHEKAENNLKKWTEYRNCFRPRDTGCPAQRCLQIALQRCKKCCCVLQKCSLEKGKCSCYETAPALSVLLADPRRSFLVFVLPGFSFSATAALDTRHHQAHAHLFAQLHCLWSSKAPNSRRKAQKLPRDHLGRKASWGDTAGLS